METLEPLVIKPTLDDDLRTVQAEIEGIQSVVDLSHVDTPLTVLRMREARLKADLKKAQRERDRKARRKLEKEKRAKGRMLHWTQKRQRRRATEEKCQNARYYVDIAFRYQRWTRRARVKAEGIGLSLEDFKFLWMRRIPRSKFRLFESTRQKVIFKRIDVKMPWSLENVHEEVRVGKHVFRWRELRLDLQEAPRGEPKKGGRRRE